MVRETSISVAAFVGRRRGDKHLRWQLVREGSVVVRTAHTRCSAAVHTVLVATAGSGAHRAVVRGRTEAVERRRIVRLEASGAVGELLVWEVAAETSLACDSNVVPL
jgi:hypothetical protein